jgi:hypothetical protein
VLLVGAMLLALPAPASEHEAPVPRPG